MIKLHRQYRYVPSYDEVMQDTRPPVNGRRIPSYDEVMGNAPAKEKIPIPETHNVAQKQIADDVPIQTHVELPIEEKPDITPDAVKLYKDYQDNLGKKIQQATGAKDESGYDVMETVDDPDAVNKSNEARDRLKIIGFDANDDMLKDLSTLPKEAFLSPHNSIEEFKKQRAENTIEYKMHVNGERTQWNIYNATYDKAINEYEGDPNQKEYARQIATTAANKFNDLNKFGTLQEAEHSIKGQQELIYNTLSGDERDKALSKLKENFSHVFTPTNEILQEEYSQSEFKDTLDINQYAGLKTLETFDHKQYEDALSILNADNEPKFFDKENPGFKGINTTKDKSKGGEEIQASIDRRMGIQAELKELADIGRQNLVDSAKRNMYNAKNVAKNSTNQDSQINAMLEYYRNASLVDQAVSDEKKDDQRYDLLAQTKFEKQVKEATQNSGMNAFEYGAFRMGKTMFISPAKGMRDFIVSNFGSDADKAKINAEAKGEVNSSIEYLPESLRVENSPVLFKFTKPLQDDINNVFSNNSLSYSEKLAQASKIVSSRQHEISTYTNPDAGKEKNAWSLARLYSTSGFVGDIVGQAFQMEGLGALGGGKLLSLATPMFADTYHDFYKQAVSEGMENKDAYANLHAGIMAIAGLVSPNLKYVKQSFGLNTSIGKFVSSVDDEVWNKVISENKTVLTKLTNGLKSASKQALEQGSVYGFGLPATLDIADNALFNKKKSVNDIVHDAAKSFMDLTMNSMVLHGFNFVSNFKSSSPQEKALVWEVGNNSKLKIEEIKEAVSKGEITQYQADQRTKLVKDVSSLIDNVPFENSKGNPLSDQQRADYLYNLYVKHKTSELKNSMPETKHDKLEGLKAQADAENDNIYEGKTPNKKEVSALAEYEFKYDSEKDIPKVLLGTKPIYSEEIEATEGSKKKISVTYSGQQLIDAGLAKEPFNETYHAIKDAIQKDVIKGIAAEGAKEALKSPEKTDAFLKDVADQALNKVADHIGNDEAQFKAAEKLYGKEVVRLAVEQYPKEIVPSKISVIKPEENASPNVVELKKNELTQNNEPAKTQSPPIAETNQNIGNTEGSTNSIKPPAGPATASEGGEGIGITHAQTGEIRKEHGLYEYEQSPETVKKWDAEADERIKAGKMQSLISKMEKGQEPDHVEQRMMGKYIAQLNDEVVKNPSDENLAKLKHAVELSDIVGGQKVGKSLVARKGTFLPDDSLGSFFLEKMDANATEELTDQQKAEVIKQHEKVENSNKEAENKVAKLEELSSNLSAKKNISEAKLTPSTKKSKTEFVEERNGIRNSILEKWKKAANDGTLTAVPLPYAKQLMAIAPDVSRLMRSYVQEGITKLDDLVATITGDLKNIIEDISPTDVRDIIAGKYFTKQETKSDIETLIRELRQEAKLVNTLEALQKGEALETEKTKSEKSEKIKQLQQQIQQIKHEMLKSQIEFSELNREEAQLKYIKGSAEKKIAELQDRIRRSDFSKPTKVSIFGNLELKKLYPKEYNEALDALARKEEAKREYDIALQKDMLAQRSKVKKGLDFTTKLLGTAKAIVSGIDDSAMFIQNIVAISAHPRSGAKAIKQHILDAVSEKRFNRNLAEIHNNPIWSTMQASGLDITEPKSLSASNKEEIFDNRIHLKFKIAGKQIDIEKYLLAPFERAFTSLGNNLRVNMFIKMTEKWAQEGISFEDDPKLFKDLATMLNTETGRGKLPEAIQRASTLISAGIWSPRLMASRLNMLGLGDISNPLLAGKKGYYASLDPRIRNMAVADFAKFVAAGTSALLVFALAGAKIDLNPLSPNFGTAQIDDKTYNMFGGFTQYVRFAAQMGLGKRMVNGQVEDLGSGYKQKSRGDLTLRFLRGKLNPAAGVAVDLATGSDFAGKPITPFGEIKKLIIPLSMRDITKAFEREGVFALLTTTVPSFVGINITNTNDYSKPTSSKKIEKTSKKAAGKPGKK